MNFAESFRCLFCGRKAVWSPALRFKNSRCRASSCAAAITASASASPVSFGVKARTTSEYPEFTSLDRPPCLTGSISPCRPSGSPGSD